MGNALKMGQNPSFSVINMYVTKHKVNGGKIYVLGVGSL